MKTKADIIKEIEKLKMERIKYNSRGMFNQDRDIIDSKLNPLKAKLEGYQLAEQNFQKMIDDLMFKGRFKGIDEETDKAYQKGNNDVLKELKKQMGEEKR